MKVCFIKAVETAKIPDKKNETDAGFDCYWSGHYNTLNALNNNIKSHSRIMIEPGQNILLSTGIKTLFPDGYVMEVKNKSSIASQGLVVGACIIDSGYRGIIFIDLHNISNKIQYIEEGQKIAQLLIYKVENPEEIYGLTEEQYNKYESTRGSGALGSTGKF